MSRFFHVFFFITIGAFRVIAQSPSMQGDLKELFSGPDNAAVYPQWKMAMEQWRSGQKIKLHYTDSSYHQPGLQRMKGVFIYAQVMAHDRYLYDPEKRQYTVCKFLDDVTRRYGGLDAVLIWPTYPNIGVDERNQFDLVADMPGGLEGVKKMVTEFKKRGVRVFFPIMIWDHGTREYAHKMPVELIREMKTIGADGLNGDTMYGVTEDFLEASDSLKYPLVLQPENNISDLEMLKWNQMSWGYFWPYKYIPGVSIYKWLEPKHQVQVTNRWQTDKTNDLQYAFFNGIGYNAWENIWGIWNEITPRYAIAIKRISAIYHQFEGIWQSRDWQPHVPVLQKGIFASLFPSKNYSIYTIVNRDTADKNGRQLKLPYHQGNKYFDLWNGRELLPVKSSDSIYLSFPVEGSGFGAILVTTTFNSKSTLASFVKSMNLMAQRPLKSYPSTWKFLPQFLHSIQLTGKAGSIPEGMVLVKGSEKYLFESNGVMIEGDELPDGVGVQHPWENHPARSQKHSMAVNSFYIDIYPVTNKQFKSFMDASHYHPKDDHNFLKDWAMGSYPQGWDNKPVTWVSIEDARAYAAWAGKRLPHEWEWQYAGQGNTSQLYPWGDVLDSSKMPAPDTSRNRTIALPNVNSFPMDASPFGIRAMTGNIWQWTDEYYDNHTRFAIVKGGSYFYPKTSYWYFPEIKALDKYGKYVLMAPSIDRAATIGFRCVMDKK